MCVPALSVVACIACTIVDVVAVVVVLGSPVPDEQCGDGDD